MPPTDCSDGPSDPFLIGEAFTRAELLMDLGLYSAEQPLHSSPLDECWEELNSDPDLIVGRDMGPPSSSPDVRNLPDADAADVMVDWFWENFEDPAERTPCDEGEYVYIWGGPCDAREELEETFTAVASEQAIDAAVERIEQDGWEWAPSQSRMQPETPSALAAAKLRLMAVLRTWRAGAKLYGRREPKAEFDVRDVAVLLRTLRCTEIELLNARSQ